MKQQIIDHLWVQGELGYKLWPQQIPIYNKVRGLGIDQAEHTVIIVGPTIKQTVDIVYQGVRKIQQDAPTGLVRRSKSESRWYIGDSELVVGGFDVQNSTRQRGKTIYKIYVEELVDSNPDDYDDAIKSDLGPALTHSECGQIIYLTTPPKIPDHPFLMDTVPEATLSNSFFKYTIDDNAQLTEQQHMACVKRCGGRESVEFQREYMCEVVRDKSVLVTPNFDKETHVDSRIKHPLHGFFQITTDWGGVRDKTCTLLHVYDYLTNKFLVLGESVQDANTATSTILVDITNLIGDLPKEELAIIADVPGQLQVDLKNMHDWDVRLPAKDDWRSACNALDVAFANDHILIHPRCQFLIESCNSGMFNKTKTDFERTRALGHCDGLAALMYAYRTQNRDNPWPRRSKHRDRYFVMPHAVEDSELKGVATAIQSKKFGGKRKL
jgi:hypothetical protein